mmetsp:Transcript_6172/g.15277  ORF Transcript_6172/g.15277 Transcript_6172/m.15277 type:complete len:139 (-) Transcript_6172:306-722(-)
MSKIKKLFVYGTLLSDAVSERILGRVPSRTDAVLPNYAMYSVKRKVYPAVLESYGSSVEGACIEVAEQEVELLDIYEGEEYKREEVSCETSDGKKQICFVYTWADNLGLELYKKGQKGWDFNEFLEQHLKGFVGEEFE